MTEGWMKNECKFSDMKMREKPRVFHDNGSLASKIAEFSNGKPHNVRAVLLTLAGAEGEGLTAIRKLANLCRNFAKEQEENYKEKP